MSEWVMAAAFDIFILTLAKDLQGLVVESHCYNKMDKSREEVHRMNHKESCVTTNIKYNV